MTSSAQTPPPSPHTHNSLPILPKRFVHPLTNEKIVVRSTANLTWGEKEVARLETTRDGVKQILALQLDRPFIVGRARECDYVISSRYASARHMRLLAHTTDSDHMFVSCEDLSSNGLVWNGRKLSQNSLLLGDGDIIEIPRCQTFLYRHLQVDSGPAKREEKAAEENTGCKTIAFKGGASVDTNSKDVTTAFTVGERYMVMSRILGTGSFSQVYLAWDKVQKKQIACKRQCMRKSDPQLFVNLRRELSILAKLSHPNINSFLESMVQEDWLYLFVEIVTGSDLFNWTVKQGRATEGEAAFIAYQLLLALSYLHERGIAHRDIKPENVLLLSAGTRFPHVQLADFGLSWEEGAPQNSSGRTGEVSPLPRAFTSSGTVAYQPPEFHISSILRNGYDPYLDDSWALGCTIALILLGFHPFDQSGFSPGKDFLFYVQEYLLDMKLTTRQELGGKELIIEDEASAPGSSFEETDGREKEEEGDGEDQIAKVPEAEQEEKQTKKQEKMPEEKELEREAKRELVRRIFEGFHWSEYPQCLRPSVDAQAFTESLLTVKAENRSTIGEALESTWMCKHSSELRMMYNSRVLRNTPAGAGKRRRAED